MIESEFLAAISSDKSHGMSTPPPNPPPASQSDTYSMDPRLMNATESSSLSTAEMMSRLSIQQQQYRQRLKGIDDDGIDDNNDIEQGNGSLTIKPATQTSATKTEATTTTETVLLPMKPRRRKLSRYEFVIDGTSQTEQQQELLSSSSSPQLQPQPQTLQIAATPISTTTVDKIPIEEIELSRIIGNVDVS